MGLRGCSPAATAPSSTSAAAEFDPSTCQGAQLFECHAHFVTLAIFDQEQFFDSKLHRQLSILVFCLFIVSLFFGHVHNILQDIKHFQRCPFCNPFQSKWTGSAVSGLHQAN
ncbi:hypothetical protein EIP86_002296 [Pleurotus ostreatoroseus]|nr:hypothetical protein EIP86_002296 [Pleurotus ostreatoroseus]